MCFICFVCYQFLFGAKKNRGIWARGLSLSHVSKICAVDK